MTALNAVSCLENYYEILVRMLTEESDIVASVYFIGLIECFDLVA